MQICWIRLLLWRMARIQDLPAQEAVGKTAACVNLGMNRPPGCRSITLPGMADAGTGFAGSVSGVLRNTCASKIRGFVTETERKTVGR